MFVQLLRIPSSLPESPIGDGGDGTDPSGKGGNGASARGSFRTPIFFPSPSPSGNQHLFRNSGVMPLKSKLGQEVVAQVEINGKT